MNNDSIIKKMPEEDELECCFISSDLAGTGFTVLSMIFQLGDVFYEFNNSLIKDKKKPQKKPTKPGKEKAAKAFEKLKNSTKEYFGLYKLVAAKIESKKHGVFVMVSYEHCPTDVIEYLISERN